MPYDNHIIVIWADRTPFDEHASRFNAPKIVEVAIVIIADQFGSRDIELYCKNEQLQRVSESHRSYDALQSGLSRGWGEVGISPGPGIFLRARKF